MDTNSQSLTVFYSWQSDLPNAINRNFIQKALDKAIKRLADSATFKLEVRVELDKDTKGVSGSPHIAETIFKKIDACAAFVADISFVGISQPADETSEEMLRKIPNPNVLIEYGYALKARGETRIIAVLNESFGKPEKLPFDLGYRRWPIQYCLNDPDDPQKPAKLDELATTLESALRQILSQHQKDLTEEEKRREKEFTNEVRRQLSVMSERFELAHPDRIGRPHFLLTAIAENAIKQGEEWNLQEGQKIVENLTWGRVTEYGRKDLRSNWFESAGSFQGRPDRPTTIVRVWDNWTVTARGEFWMLEMQVPGQPGAQRCFDATGWEDETINFIRQLVKKMREKWPRGRIFLQLEMKKLEGYLLLGENSMPWPHLPEYPARIRGDETSRMAIVDGEKVAIQVLIATLWQHLGLAESPRHAELFEKTST